MNCNGCKSLRLSYHGQRECSYTKIGTKDITICACKGCLLKTICQEPCPEFKKGIWVYRQIVNSAFIPSLTYLKKENKS